MSTQSIAGDLTQLAKGIGKVCEKPDMAMVFTLPPDYKEVPWVTNVSRQDGIALLGGTAKMQGRIN